MGLKEFLFGGKQIDREEIKNGQSKDPAEAVRGTEGHGAPRYRVLRECVTGVTEYGYFHDKRPLGAAMVMMASGFPTRLQGEDLHLCSEFDKTIFPGVTRELMDEVSGNIYGRVTYYAMGTHALTIPGESLVVQSEPGVWRFLREGVLIAQLKRMGEPGSELALYPREALPDTLALLMMSFPLLQIGR